MRGNPDPKPGRWILPLVILGMVGFTYVVVSSVEPAQPEAANTTTTLGEDTTTTTSVDPALATYLQGLEDSEEESRAILAEAEAINARWDGQEQDFSTTLQQLEELRDRAEVFADAVETRTPPAGLEDLATAHAQVIAAADRIFSAAQAMIDGLRAPDAGQQRRAALESLREATAEFLAAGQNARQIATGQTSA